jgi:hypothetical protein
MEDAVQIHITIPPSVASRPEIQRHIEGMSGRSRRRQLHAIVGLLSTEDDELEIDIVDDNADAKTVA